MSGQKSFTLIKLFIVTPQHPDGSGQRGKSAVPIGRQASSFTRHKRSVATEGSFTLIELLIVIGILAVLVAAIIITLNPAQLLAQARDSKRQQDLSALNQALNTITALDQSLFMGTSSIVYTSLPDSTTTCASWNLPSLPSGWQYHCSPTTTLQNTDGTGWIPVNFKTTGVVSLSSLPIDPQNTSSTGLYYTYVTGGSFQLASHFESAKYQATEGSDAMYTVGSNTTLAPFLSGLVGYWPLNEGAGTIAYDRSGYGNNGTLVNGPTWISGVHTSLQLSGINYSPYTNSYVSLANVEIPTSSFSVSVWFYLNNDAMSLGFSNTILTENNGVSLYQHGANDYLYFGYGPRFITWTPTAGSWHNLICSVTNGGNSTVNWQGQCYGDGALKVLNQDGYFTAASLVSIGQNSGSVYSTSINGMVRDVRIYNRALSASEVQALYNATK